MKSAEDHARSTDGFFAELVNTVRRMAITLTTQALWQLAGVRNLDGSTETVTIEPFTGIGFFSRPPSSGSPEAIVVFAGGPKAGAIVAVRDEKTRQAIAGALAQDETMMFNSQAVVYLKADGTIEARTASGAAVPLALKSDVDALAAYVSTQFQATAGHTHATPSGPTTTIVTVIAGGTGHAAPTVAPPTAAGTLVLKGQ